MSVLRRLVVGEGSFDFHHCRMELVVAWCSRSEVVVFSLVHDAVKRVGSCGVVSQPTTMGGINEREAKSTSARCHQDVGSTAFFWTWLLQ